MAKRKSLETQKSKARAVLEAIAKRRGFTFDELAQLATTIAKKASVASRYRNPDNPDVTWSGRGRRPKWFDDYIRAGNDPGDLEV